MADKTTTTVDMPRGTPSIEDEIAMITKQKAQAPRGNGPEATRPQGVAEDLAKFVEQHAEDMMRQAEEHLEQAREFAKQIRDLTAEQINRLTTFTNSIKDSQTSMAEVRTKFLSASTTPEVRHE